MFTSGSHLLTLFGAPVCPALMTFDDLGGGVVIRARRKFAGRNRRLRGADDFR
jgi:hypothetical protein